MIQIVKWLISITRHVLSPLFISTICRILDQFLGISLYLISVWSIFKIYSFSQTDGPDYSFIFKVLIALVIIALSKAFLRYGEQFFGHYVAFKSLELLRRELFAKLWPQAPAVMYKANSGDLLAIATKDIDRIEVFFAHTFAPAVSAIVVSATAIGFGFYFTNSSVALVALFFVFSSLVVVPLYGQRKIISLQNEYISKRGVMAAHMTDSLQGINEIIGYGAENKRLDELDNLHKDILSSISYTNTVFAARRGINNFIWVIQIPILFITGIHTHAQIVNLVLFIVATIRLNEVLRGVEGFSTDLNASLACAKRLYEICNTEPIVSNDGEEVEQADSYGIKINNLYFTYPGTEREVLKNINLNFAPNTWSCIVGSTGCGKSTLMNLVQRFFEPKTGEILLNGKNINAISVDSLRTCVSLVTQNTYLFNDTILNNLRLANPNASEEKIWNALRIACLDEEIKGFDLGLQTLVGEKGKSLSGGQVQRLCLARAVLLNSKVLILDEFTAHLNTELEEKVRSRIRKYLPNTTIIEITHRLDAIKDADQVVVMDSGKVIEQENPSVLLHNECSALNTLLRRGV